MCLSLEQLIAQGVGEPRDDLVLHLQQIGPRGIELIRPKMGTAIGIDELGVDAHPVLVPPHRAFEHVAHAELLADLLGVYALALVGKGRVARDDEAAADARQIGGEVFGYAIGKIILARIARKVREWKHNDRKAGCYQPWLCRREYFLRDCAIRRPIAS